MTEVEKLKIAKKLGISIEELTEALEFEEENIDNFILVTENGIPTIVFEADKVNIGKLLLRKRYNLELNYYGFSFACAPSIPRNKDIVMSLFTTLHEDRRNIFFKEI